MCERGARTADGSSQWHKAIVLPVSDRGGFHGAFLRVQSGTWPVTKERYQMTLASGKSGEWSVDRGPGQQHWKWKASCSKKMYGTNQILQWHVGILSALQNMLTSRKVRSNWLKIYSNQMEELTAAQTILISNIWLCQQLKEQTLDFLLSSAVTVIHLQILHRFGAHHT